MSQIGEGGAQIAQPDFRHEILSGQLGEFAGEMFNSQTALEQFETFLDPPASMVEIGEPAGREGIRIEQRGCEKFGLPERQTDTDTEMTLTLRQPCEQPVRREFPIQQQKVVCPNVSDAIRQDLAFASFRLEHIGMGHAGRLRHPVVQKPGPGAFGRPSDPHEPRTRR